MTSDPGREAALLPELPADAITVAIDGPSGSGKSSLAKAVARSLGIGFLDTGATYRALTWWCLDQGIDLADRDAVAAAADGLPMVLGTDPDDAVVEVGGTDISAEIRTTRVSEVVSLVATNTLVRPILQHLQRATMVTVCAQAGGVVAEGRDITTVVAPDARVRLLVTASVEARLARRATELHGEAGAVAVAATRDQIVRRDADDSTVSEFTRAADGVITLDTSDLDFAQSAEAALRIVRAEIGLDS